jgi:CHAD domain-containing protein
VFLHGAWVRGDLGAESDDAAPRAAREAAYERARSAVSGARFGAVVLETMGWIETGPWTLERVKGARRRDRSVARFSAAWLRKSHRRLVASGVHLERQTAEARHQVRIQAKGLRYAADVFYQLFDSSSARKAARTFLARLEGLLETLGDLNDAHAAIALARGFADGSRIVASETAREAALTMAAARAFKAFKAADPFWTRKT